MRGKIAKKLRKAARKTSPVTTQKNIIYKVVDAVGKIIGLRKTVINEGYKKNYKDLKYAHRANRSN